MHKSKLLVTTYYLQVFYNNMKLGILFNRKGCQRFYQFGQVTFSKSVFWSLNRALSLFQIYYIQTSNSYLVCILTHQKVVAGPYS